MPAGFIVLGVFLIYFLMYEQNISKKLCYVTFLLLAMLGYVISPISVGNISVNIIFVVLGVVAIANLVKQESGYNLIKLFILLLTLSISYIILTKINSSFVVAINPYPICFLIMLFSVFYLQQFKFVVLFNISSFFVISLCNLFLERWLGMMHFASVGFSNLIIVIIAVLFLFNLILNNSKVLKRSR